MRPTLRSATLAAALCSVFGAALALVTDSEAGAAPALSRPAQAEISPCDASLRASVEPETIALGETVDVTLHASVTCSEEAALHLALVLDGSSSMTPESLTSMKESAKAMVDALELGDYPRTRIGVVEFAESAVIRCDLTADIPEIEACIDGIGSEGPTVIDSGIKSGMQMLTAGRSGFSSSDLIREILIVFSDGKNEAGCGPVEAESNRAKGQGVLMITKCVGAECDSVCVRRVATSARYHFGAEQTEALLDALGKVIENALNISAKRISITEVLIENMAYVPDSADPPVSTSTIAIGRLDWTYNIVPEEGFTMTWKVRPIESGIHPVSTGASGTFIDLLNRTGELSVAAPTVNVVAPAPDNVFIPYAEQP